MYFSFCRLSSKHYLFQNDTQKRGAWGLSIWAPRRLWGQSLLLYLGLGQQLCMVLAGGCQTSPFKHEIHFSGPEKRRIWYVALPYPQDSTHMLCVPCCNLWDVPLSLVCPSRICRELCVQVRLQVLLQQHTSGAEVSRLMRGVQDSQIGILYYPATRCPTPSSSLTMTNSYGLDICPSGDVLSYWRVVHTASQGYPGGLKQACRTAPLIPVPVPDCLRLHFRIVTSIYIVFSATALLPNSISPLLLPLLKSIGFLMLHKLIVSLFRLPCHSSFCLFSLWTGRVFLLEGVKEWPVREPV